MVGPFSTPACDARIGKGYESVIVTGEFAAAGRIAGEV
jgi:hypothetical protein